MNYFFHYSRLFPLGISKLEKMKKNVTRTVLVFCPKCEGRLDAVTDSSGNDELPEEGSISICYYCGVLLEFNADLDLNLLPEKTLKEIRENDPKTWRQIQRAQEIIKNTNEPSEI